MSSMREWDYDTALERLTSLCVRSEQCESQLRGKMRLHGVGREDADRLIDWLYEHRFLDEERFAGAYARTKMRFAGWGKVKIRLTLASLGIAEGVIRSALDTLDENEYRSILAKRLESVLRQADVTDPLTRQKVFRRMWARGYESALLNELLGDI